MSSSSTMRAVVLGPSGVDVRTLERPEPGRGEVRLKVEACGLCGTDLHVFHQGMDLPGGTPGHEVVGRIDAIGEGVTGASLGSRVVVEPVRSCGQCARCLEGRGNICREFQIHGVHLPGGFAEAMVVPAAHVYGIADDLVAAVAAFSEPVAVCLHGLARAGMQRDARVLVLGAGSIGLVSILCAKHLGAREVWVTARHDSQAKLASELGAHRVLAESDASPAKLAQLSLETDFDVVLETVGGRANTLEVATAALRPGGTIGVLGLFQEPVSLETFPLLMKEATLAWSNCYTQPPGEAADFERAARLVEAERERLALLTTHQLPLERAAEAFAVADDKKAGAVKVSVVP